MHFGAREQIKMNNKIISFFAPPLNIYDYWFRIKYIGPFAMGDIKEAIKKQ